MSRVFSAGEVVYDIIFRDNLPVSACPGGSMLNTAVSLGRTGMQSWFIGECGKDNAGDIVSLFLAENGVNTSFLHQLPGKQTTISLAFLDDRKEADYAFYKSEPGNAPMGEPDFRKDDVLLFGSYHSISEIHREKTFNLVSEASSAGSLIMYDPNFRRPHSYLLKELIPFIERNIRSADIIRGSSDDFSLIFGTHTASETAALRYFKEGKTLIYTSGGGKVSVYSAGFSLKFDVPPVDAVSTIGAGDAFNAGIIRGISVQGGKKTCELKRENWEEIVHTGIAYARAVCQSIENYVPVGFSLD